MTLVTWHKVPGLEENGTQNQEYYVVVRYPGRAPRLRQAPEPGGTTHNSLRRRACEQCDEV